MFARKIAVTPQREAQYLGCSAQLGDPLAIVLKHLLNATTLTEEKYGKASDSVPKKWHASRFRLNRSYNTRDANVLAIFDRTTEELT